MRERGKGERSWQTGFTEKIGALLSRCPGEFLSSGGIDKLQHISKTQEEEGRSLNRTLV